MAGEPNTDLEQLYSAVDAEAIRGAETAPSDAEVAHLVGDFHNAEEGVQPEQARVAVETAPTNGAKVIDLAARAEQQAAAAAERDIEIATTTPGGPMAYSTDLYNILWGKRVA